mmetsp:Transcript_7562/g.18960  ORF Transcript_7562/g.18960 Transcript_7562/m.18960 type:complete len:259 (+) Transcript_7562:239-1015(+)
MDACSAGLHAPGPICILLEALVSRVAAAFRAPAILKLCCALLLWGCRHRCWRWCRRGPLCRTCITRHRATCDQFSAEGVVCAPVRLPLAARIPISRVSVLRIIFARTACGGWPWCRRGHGRGRGSRRRSGGGCGLRRGRRRGRRSRGRCRRRRCQFARAPGFRDRRRQHLAAEHPLVVAGGSILADKQLPIDAATQLHTILPHDLCVVACLRRELGDAAAARVPDLVVEGIDSLRIGDAHGEVLAHVANAGDVPLLQA